MHQVHDFKQKQPPACDIWYKNPCGGVFWPSQTLWAELGQFLTFAIYLTKAAYKSYSNQKILEILLLKLLKLE